MRRIVCASLVCALAAAGCSKEAVRSAGPSPKVSPSPASPEPSPTPKHDFSSLDRGIRVSTPDVEVYARPDVDSASHRMPAHNPMGEQLVFLAEDSVTRQGEAWYEVLLPRRPNGSTAWIEEGKGVRVVELKDLIEIDLSKFTLSRFTSGKLVDRFKVGIGQSQWPTPTGIFYAWAHVPQPSPTGPYGAYAIGLSGFSPVLTDWPGGGRFAIHGTPYKSNTGLKISHGCIRVFNKDVLGLRNVPLGTPVIITR